MLVCVFLLMCLKLLSDAVRHIGLPSAQPSAHVSGPPPCTSWNNETGVCLERELCKTIDDTVIEAADFGSVCNAADQAPTKVCCPHGSRSILMKATEKDRAHVVDWGKCGVSNKTLNKVVGGHNATLGDWPWMVALYYRSSLSSNLYFHCGGSLISDRWIVTAAHCIRDVNGTLEPSIARLGDLNLDESVNDGAEPVDVYIDGITRHPNYTQTPAIINDIALLHLQEAVKFTKFIRPICLLQGAQFRQDSYYNRKRPYVTGWGRKAFNGSLSAILQETSLPIINNTECAQAYAHRNMARIDETVLCAGRGGKDSCQGDSGGPLMLPNAELRAFFLAGIVSYGIRCADHFPGVYTRIPAFTDWIAEITGIKF